MCLGPDGELEGQVSLNELLIAMGEPPVEPRPEPSHVESGSVMAGPSRAGAR